MGIRVSAWELPVGQYWILRCQHGAFQREGQFHPPWGLIAGIRGGMRGRREGKGGQKRKLKGKGGRFEGTTSVGRTGEESGWKWLWQGFEIEWSVNPSGWLVEWVRNIVATYE